jgi:hypothetical protein
MDPEPDDHRAPDHHKPRGRVKPTERRMARRAGAPADFEEVQVDEDAERKGPVNRSDHGNDDGHCVRAAFLLFYCVFCFLGVQVIMRLLLNRPAPAASRSVLSSRSVKTRAIPHAAAAVVTVFGVNDILPDFMNALMALGCKTPVLPGDISESAPHVAPCIANLVVPTPLEQSQIMRAMENLSQKVPIEPIAPTVFRLLIAHDIETLEKLLNTYEAYLTALHNVTEVIEHVN